MQLLFCRTISRLLRFIAIPLLLPCFQAAHAQVTCATLASVNSFPGLPTISITAVTSNPVTVATSTSPAMPAHCELTGAMNKRVGSVDGKPYAINFQLRLPTPWNGRFFMQGGGGTDGTLGAAVGPLGGGQIVNALSLNYAVVSTDSGHDNTLDNDPNAGGSADFGVDPQARIDFGYNSYDLVTRAGKAYVETYYGKPPEKSYFVGCSEGGREGLLMAQRFPENYDGIVAGDPVLHLPLGPMAGVYLSQVFAGLATRSGLFLANGQPAIANTYSDPDLMLVSNAVLAACDKLDGLVDGIVDNGPACTSERVYPKLLAIQCTGAKSASCLTADQISSMEKSFAGPVNSKGEQLYSAYPWDAGMSGQNGTAYNQSWRSWWLGSYNATTNSSIKLAFAPVLGVAYTQPPVLPLTNAFNYAMGYNFDTDVPKIYATSGIYTEGAKELWFTDSTDMSAFKARHGKLMIYQGGTDSSVSLADTRTWYNAMNKRMDGHAQSFARFFPVPGMNHCSGGPATDTFNMLPPLVDWVENGIAPKSVIATASTPGYFGVASRSRPLCPYPKQARYLGTGDINEASNFTCRDPRDDEDGYSYHNEDSHDDRGDE